jgi:hypothetical protein
VLFKVDEDAVSATVFRFVGLEIVTFRQIIVLWGSASIAIVLRTLTTSLK